MADSFYIDGQSLKSTYGIDVKNITGLWGDTEAKAPFSIDWPDEDGIEQYILETGLLFKSSVITMECIYKGTAGQTNIANLLSYLKSNPIVTLEDRLFWGVTADVCFSKLSILASRISNGYALIYFKLEFINPSGTSSAYVEEEEL